MPRADAKTPLINPIAGAGSSYGASGAYVRAGRQPLVAVLAESDEELRVALAPDNAAKLIKAGFRVRVQKGAGGASFSDAAYGAVGAALGDGAKKTVAGADVVLKINTLTLAEVALLPATDQGCVAVSYVNPSANGALVAALAARRVTALCWACIPRISRAQKMDVLSSMAGIAGYRAVVEAAHLFGRFFCGQITAAANMPPAKVLVIGAGVAGLTAVGTAKSLGAVVRAFDTREVCREQVYILTYETSDFSSVFY